MEVGNDDESSLDGSLRTCFERQQNNSPSVIVVGGGISGLAAAQALQNAFYNVIVLEAQDRIGGRIHTDYSFGCPIDMGASWLHGVCNENPLSPVIRRLGLTMYRTSGDDSILYDHDFQSCSLYDLEGNRIPNDMVSKVGDAFKKILEATDKVRDEQSHDISVREAISMVLDRQPELRLGGQAHEVLEWCICRMEAWFAADASMISLKAWDQEKLLTGGHGVMVQGYDPVIKALSRHLDIRLNHRVKRILNRPKKVVVTTEDGTHFAADAAIITVPLGILKANTITFEPKLPDWKQSAISDLGVGNENKVALKFDRVFWPNVELLGIVAPTSYTCGYFLNLHKATGHPVLVYMAAGASANDLEKLSNDSAVEFVMMQLKRMFPEATKPVQYLVSRWGSDPNIRGCYSYDAVGNSEDIYDRLRAPVGSLFFGGEAASVDHQGSVHGAYSAGILAAESCQRHILQRMGILERVAAVGCREEVAAEAMMSPLRISRL